ncbi:hypothetical protein CQW23_16419 [Capsicum baccatum]|uniref:Leucine-rich repeat-containing N-terminal plant-type domain-containing protein n=1 Tax=Capsicum baccatum TaxID=33114 RepID=A0A2G2WAX7_CAPBA|nr:hypothetical protein CQW23_16419 [Capsicum baccatum]
MSFKSLLTDPSNRLSSRKGENYCNWKGIKCSGRVVVVNLQNPHLDEMINVNKEVVSSSNNTFDFSLKGTISPLLFILDHIQYLDLSFNNFMLSKFPVEILNLTKLTYLNLSNSMLQDSITTQFSNLTSLRSLDLSCSNLLPDLSSITVSLTLIPKLDSGSLLSFISYGYLSSQNLRGLEGLQCLRYLVLTGVDISKSSESFHWEKPISSLSNLMSLQLSNCNISGRIPIVWTVPPSLSNSTSITVFLDDGCSIEGEVHGVRSISLSGNKIHGPIPESLCQAANVIQLTGTVRKELERVTSLQYLDLNGNEFEGSFLTAIEKFQNLEMLNLARNIFEGRIPKFIGDLHHLRILMLASNSYNESIPEGLMMLENLQYIGLSRNNLSGSIPENLEGLKMMTKTQNQTTIFGYFYCLKFTGAQLEIVTKRQTQFLVIVYSYNTGFDVSPNEEYWQDDFTRVVGYQLQQFHR